MDANATLGTKELFASIGKLITSSLELHEILSGIMEEVRLFFSPENWSLIRYDSTSDSLLFVIVEGINYQSVKDVRLKPGEGIAGTVVQTGKSIFVADTSNDSRFSNKVDKLTGYVTQSIIAVPIKYKNIVYGVIEIVNGPNGSNFTEDQLLILNTIADFAAIAFANQKSYSEVIALSETDQLTRLNNRAGLEAYIAEIEGADPQKRRESDRDNRAIIIFMDLNNFKEVNDNYSHAEGDEVLRRVGMRLHSTFRRKDIISRVGGDEFVVIIQLPAKIDFEKVINRIEKSLSLFRIASVEKDYTVTLSYGITVGLPGEIRQLIEQADRSMYEKKQDSKAE